MGNLNMWREARATVMRKEFEDAIAKAPGPKAPARFAFLYNVTQTHGAMLILYSAASPSERRAILRGALKAATSMWRQGAWPSALGFEIACLNVESRFVPGADAAYVKAETDKIIEEATQTQRSMHRLDPPPAGAWVDAGAACLVAPFLSRGGRMGRDRLRQLAITARQINQACLQSGNRQNDAAVSRDSLSEHAGWLPPAGEERDSFKIVSARRHR